MKSTDGFEHHREALELADMLKMTPLAQYGVSLHDCIESRGAVTEMFMCLRWHTGKLLEEEDCPEFVRAKAKRLWKELDSQLQP